LPILERHDAKATFFLSPAHISENRRFWWDALHAHGVRAFSEYQEMPFGEARSRIEGRWPGSFRPAGELDRAMSLDELMALAASDRVEIGHHSFNHTVLAGRDWDYVEAEIAQANAFFQHHLGFKPEAIAYPNGVYTDTLVDVCVELGLRIGLTCDFRSERLSQNPGKERLMRLGRVMVSGTRPLLPQLSAATLQPSVKGGVYDLKRALR
jgi:peptidoglycan/xylan/chitin deacetylase (PgdA/CDA1 family)